MTTTEPTAQPTRDPAPKSTQLVQGVAILTPLATIVSWLASLLPVEVPAEVQSAIAALVVVLGGVVFSEFRDRKHLRDSVGTSMVFPFVVLCVFAVGCVSWNGDAYRKLANDELLALAAAQPDQALDPDRCLALNLGALALEDREGGSTSLNAPFFSGQHVAEMAVIHAKQSKVCGALLKREADQAVEPSQRTRSRSAWRETWLEGRALHGGG